MKAKTFPAGTVIFPKIGAAIATNKKRILTREATFDNNVMGIIPNVSKLVPEYLLTLLLSFDLSRWASDAQPPSMRKTTVEEHRIPVPDLETQHAITADIEAEQVLIKANKNLIARFEAKIKAAVERVWVS
jgi:restriction endonuclease S subunit